MPVISFFIAALPIMELKLLIFYYLEMSKISAFPLEVVDMVIIPGFQLTLAVVQRTPTAQEPI